MRKYRAFTLIELIASIVVIGIIAAAGAPVLLASIRAYDSALNTAEAIDKMRYANERMAREFREACTSTGFTVSSTAPSFIKTDWLISGSAITSTIYSVAISSNTATGNVSISYTASGTTRTGVLTDQMSSASPLTFTFYDSSGNTTTTAASVRFVEIRLALTVNGQDRSLRTRVALQAGC